MLDPHFKAALDAVAAANPNPPPLDGLPAPMVRMGYKAMRTMSDQTAPRDVATRDLTVGGAAGDIPARLYVPAGAPDVTGGLVYFHGGGFVIGDLDTHDGLCRRLAALAGVRVLSVDYRLAPEHPYPASHDDALAATKWAFDHAAEIGFDPARIAVGGDSAGGNLAAVVSLDLRLDPVRRLAFQLLFYPGIWPEEETASRKALDGPVLTRESLDWFEKCLAVPDSADGTRASPARAVEVSGAPPALVTTAGFDPLKDEGRAYAEKLRAGGVPAQHIEYPSLVHDFYTMADVSPAVPLAIAEAAAALKAGLG